MNMKQARSLVKLSQTQLARVSGVKKSAISDIERGKVSPENVAHGTVTRLVVALQRSGLPDVTAKDLFPVQSKVA